MRHHTLSSHGLFPPWKPRDLLTRSTRPCQHLGWFPEDMPLGGNSNVLALPGLELLFGWEKTKVVAAISCPSMWSCITCERGCGYCWEEVMRNALWQEGVRVYSINFRKR